MSVCVRRFVLVWLVSLCGLVGGLGFALSSAFAFQTHLFEGGFGTDGTAATVFGEPLSLAVDQSTGDVYVGDVFPSEAVQKFNAAHEPEPFTGVSPGVVEGKLTGFDIYGGAISADQLAVNSTSHDLYVVSNSSAVRAYQADGEPADFTAGPGAGTNNIVGSEVCGVAVDSNGDIYENEYTNGVQIYAASGEHLASIPSNGTCNLAVDSHGAVYLNRLENPPSGHTGPVEKFVPSEFPVTSTTTYASAGTVDANASFTVAVDPSTDHLYVDEGRQIVEYDENGVQLGASASRGAGALTNSQGLAVNGASGRVYASNLTTGSQVEVFGPAVVLPDARTGEAGEIHPQGTAMLNGSVNPDGVEVTECRFDYGTSIAYGHTAACLQASGSGTGEVSVSAQVTGLEPGRTYHFRLEASNHNGTNFGEDVPFTMPPRPSIDATSAANVTGFSVDLSAQVNPGGLTTVCRMEYGTSLSYGTAEACKPASLQGTADVAVKWHVEGLSADVTYHWRVVASSEAGSTTGSDHTFVYDTAGGGLPDNRAYEMVTPSQKNAALLGHASLAGASVDVSEDGSRLMMPSIQCLAGAASCTASRESLGEQSLFTRGGGGWSYTALAPPATQFEANSLWLASAETGMELVSMPTPPMFEDDFYVREPGGSFVDIGPTTTPSGGAQGVNSWGTFNIAATSDFSHVVYQLGTPYEFVGTGNTAPVPVGVSGGSGSTDFISSCLTELGASINSASLGSMSADGRTVYFTAKACSSGTGSNAGIPVPGDAVYARIDEARTVKLSERSPADCTSVACQTSIPANARFMGASADGSMAFFTSPQQLTDEASEGVGNLYEYDFAGPAGHNLIDVSGGDTSGGGPRVQGVMAISGDGSHVYFVASGVLSTTANEYGDSARDGADNLYVFERDASHPQGRVGFVAALPNADREEWSRGPADAQEVNVTPDGRFLVFASRGALTPDAARRDDARQVFRYDAQTGGLLRLSVGQEGFNDNGNGSPGAACEAINGCPFDARIVGPFTDTYRAGPTRGDPTMSHDGAYVFFESPVGLTPRALNEVQVGTSGGRSQDAENVYEWHEGHVYLISDGRDTFATGGVSTVGLWGSDATGANVFFSTADSLIAQDTDTQVDYYDARICTAGEPCIAPSPPVAPCAGEACHGTPAATPSLAGTPSATFSGSGNVAPAPVVVLKKKAARKKPSRCPKGRQRRRGRCVKVKARARAKRTGKTNSHRGGK